MQTNDSIIRVSAHQMSVCADIDINLARIRRELSRSAEAGAHIAAFPECAVSGYPPLHHQSAADIDCVGIAQANDEIRCAARQYGVWVVFGTILMSDEGLLNSALVVDNAGEIKGRYDKLHLMPRDKDVFLPGHGVPLFETDAGRFGVLICYDARFPEPFRYLREQGAEFIINISNACGGDTWKAPVLEGTYRTRASENSCFVVAVNAAGPLQMAASRIVDPLGLDLASANMDREEMLVADMDLSQTDSGYFHDRRSDQFQVLPLFAD